MFADDIRRALQGTPRERLAELSAAVWKGFACGVLAEDEAQALAEEIAARKIVPPKPAEPRRRVGSRPRTSASLERRRSWAAGSWMPPGMAAGFTQAEAAALAVIIREIATTGRCGLPISAIAGKAGVCATSARNAVREARRRGILHVEERRVARDRNLPNLLTIVSRELALWVRTRARIEGQGGAIKSLRPTTILCFNNPARSASAGRKMGNQGEAWPSTERSASPAHHPRSTTCETRVSQVSA